jgi:hypothetical protein
MSLSPFGRRLTVGTIVAATTGLPLPTMAQGTSSGSPAAQPTSPAPQSRERWRFAPSLQVDEEYDDNVFLLKAARKDNVSRPSVGDAASGRFADMQSATDLITTLDGSLGFSGPGMLGRKLTVEPRVTFEFFAQNSRRRNIALGFSLAQALPHHRRLRLNARTMPGYFSRNFLADALDANADGSISPEERIYRPGVYSESDVSLDYRFRVKRGTRKKPFGAELQFGGGFYSRAYDSPFNGWDVHGPTAGAALMLDLTRHAALDIDYDFAALSAYPATQVLILDEPDFGQDLNGNGSTSDLAARYLGTVDRSRGEHRVGTTLRLEKGKRTDIRLAMERRWRLFTSKEPLDVLNNGRTDVRTTLGAELRFKLAPGMRFDVGAEIVRQRLNRENDPGQVGEIDDYAKSRIRAGFSRGF